MNTLHPLSGGWRLAWTNLPRHIKARDLHQLTYNLLPKRMVVVEDFRQFIDVEQKSWVDIIDLDFLDGYRGIWTSYGTLEAPTASTAPIDLHVRFHRAEFVSKDSKPTEWITPFADRTYDLQTGATATTIVLGERCRIDRDGKGKLTMLRRVSTT